MASSWHYGQSVPYDRDAGMTERQATRLAATMRDAGMDNTALEREGRYFVIVVRTKTGSWTVRDEEDWRWLAARL